MKCSMCGKFRKLTDIAGLGDVDEFARTTSWTECRWCMSAADRKTYRMELA